MDTQAIVNELRETGLAHLRPIGQDDMRQVLWHFGRNPVYVDAHIPATAANRGETTFERSHERAANSECVCAPMAVTIKAPWIFERGLALREVACNYLHTFRPLAYSMNAFWTRPGAAPLRDDIQAFHRDMDDPKGFLAMFVYLTAVHDDADGPHVLVGPDGNARRVYGPAGTVFVADTSHNHCGLKPTRRERGMAWFRWGVSDPPDSYVWDKNEPIPAQGLDFRYPVDPVLRDAVKLLVTP